jgi:hypothetical protein
MLCISQQAKNLPASQEGFYSLQLVTQYVQTALSSEVRRATHCHLMSRLGKSGTILPVYHMPSWRTQGQLHIELVIYPNSDTGDRAVCIVCLKLLHRWNRGFEVRWGHVFVVCCVGSGVCDEPNTRSEESYRVCVCVCDKETSTLRRSRSYFCCSSEGKKKDTL